MWQTWGFPQRKPPVGWCVGVIPSDSLGWCIGVIPSFPAYRTSKLTSGPTSRREPFLGLTILVGSTPTKRTEMPPEEAGYMEAQRDISIVTPQCLRPCVNCCLRMLPEEASVRRRKSGVSETAFLFPSVDPWYGQLVLFQTNMLQLNFGENRPKMSKDAATRVLLEPTRNIWVKHASTTSLRTVPHLQERRPYCGGSQAKPS